jgi:hypothetical protein
MPGFDKNERNTRPNLFGHPNKEIADLQYHLGTVMAECALLQRRTEILEKQVEILVSGKNDSEIPTSKSSHRYFLLAKKTFLAAAVIISGIIAAAKELGFFKP